MEILTAVGEINNATEMVKIESSHISGSSYKEAGDAGIKLLRFLSAARVRVPTTLSSIGIDVQEWKRMRIPRHYASKQYEMLKLYEKIGIISTCTCTPYLSGNVPRFGQHLAWTPSESIIAANSQFGAMTNRESDVTALASAICGRTPMYGYHLKENRKGQILVKVESDLDDVSDYGALGYYVGKIVGSENPVFEGLPSYLGVEELKSLGAALATSGAVALYHIPGVTPEALTADVKKGVHETTTVGKKEIEETYEILSSSAAEKVDIISIGCPHCSIGEIRSISAALRNRKVAKGVSLWVCTSPAVKAIADKMGFTHTIDRAGGMLLTGLCPHAMPNEIYGTKTVATNSAKAAHYIPELCGVSVHFGNTRKCIEAAISGRWS
jgi:predicted aconitase